MNRDLHIVCEGLPWPLDTDRNIDVYKRLETLHQLGVELHVHSMEKCKRTVPEELKNICCSVDLYKQYHSGLNFTRPPESTLASGEMLVASLNSVQDPIIFEGLNYKKLFETIGRQSRKLLIRPQPGELGNMNGLPEPFHFACACKKDASLVEQNSASNISSMLSMFLPWQKVNGAEGIGNFCLYHGDFSAADDEAAAIWLLQKVFSKIKVPFIIAGAKPSRRLEKQAELCQHTCLVADPDETELNDLVLKAHIHVLPLLDKDKSGISTKLLHALLEGRHCVVNDNMVDGTGLEEACHVGTTANAIASIILQLVHRPFPPEEIALRQRLLGIQYDNEMNGRKIIQWLW